MKPIKYIFLAAIAFSCSNSTDSLKSQIIPTIRVDLSNAQVLDFDELFDSMEIIQLETNPKSLIGNIRTLQVKDSDLYLSHTADRYLHRYTNSGDFIRRYGRIGRGPGELYTTAFFFVDSLLLYFHIKNRVVAYDLNNGNVVIDKQVPFFAYSFVKKDSSSWLFYRSRVSPDYKERFWKTNAEFENVSNLMMHDTTAIYVATNIRNIHVSRQQHYLFDPGIDTIYRFHNDSTQVAYIIDFGHYRDRAEFKEFSSLDDMGRIPMRPPEEYGRFARPVQFFINDSNIWIHIIYKKQLYLLRYDRRENTTSIYNSVINGPDFINAGELLFVNDSEIYLTIPDRVLQNLSVAEIEEYNLERLYAYRKSLPVDSNPFIVVLKIKE